MVFSSILYTFIFMPIVFLLYFLAKEKYRNVILLIASLIFYGTGEPKAVILMVVSIIINYFAGLLIGRTEKSKLKKTILIIDIIANLGILYYFKYLDYTITVFNVITKKNVSILNIALPIGISFFTFQAMSYVIDVYRKDAKAEKNILNVGLYIALFPQLVAGPIVRYNTIAEQIKKREISLDKFGDGTFRFLGGFAKKILLANNFALVANYSFGYADLKSMPISLAWIGSIAFSLQIFFDFSGYSDMAIGLGKMFGFDFQENFNYPYISKSITEFWRRWHISLSQWFRDYVYIPLGGSRVSAPRRIFNLFAVWALTGLWHGANLTFVAWGLMYFVMLVFEKYVLKPDKRNIVIKIIWQIATLFIVNAGWILFNIVSFRRAIYYMGAMFGCYGNAVMCPTTTLIFREYGFYLVIGILFSTPIVPKLIKLIDKNSTTKKIGDIAIPLGYIVAFLWSVSFLILGAHNPFIYFNF